ncbi:hypothetical protein E2C01_077314 [Portunus trituberculatus]|uniref:Uncharacterized protein n=1 Tax=Portunus trituberculatus TaxID=210409 RepID=A0A5B7IL36_PORTR|nr:hypothetical protein [Portunus trituberculatus]
MTTTATGQNKLRQIRISTLRIPSLPATLRRKLISRLSEFHSRPVRFRRSFDRILWRWWRRGKVFAV